MMRKNQMKTLWFQILKKFKKFKKQSLQLNNLLLTHINMGANQSNQNMKVLNETLTNVSTSVLMSATSNTSATANVNQDMSVVIGPDAVVDCASFNVTQDAAAAVTVLSKLTESQMSSLGNKISSQFNSELDAKLKQKNSGLNLGQVNASQTSEQIKNVVKTNIKTAMKASIKNNIKADANTNQVQSIVINGKLDSEGGCNFGQKSAVKLVASNIAANLSKLIEKNTSVTKASNKETSTVSQTNVGLSLMGLLAGLFVIIAIGALFYFGGMDAVEKYGVPIAIVVSLLLCILFAVKKDAIPAVIAGVVFLGAGGFEAYELFFKKDAPL